MHTENFEKKFIKKIVKIYNEKILSQKNQVSLSYIKIKKNLQISNNMSKNY